MSSGNTYVRDVSGIYKAEDPNLRGVSSSFRGRRGSYRGFARGFGRGFVRGSRGQGGRGLFRGARGFGRGGPRTRPPKRIHPKLRLGPRHSAEHDQYHEDYSETWEEGDGSVEWHDDEEQEEKWEDNAQEWENISQKPVDLRIELSRRKNTEYPQWDECGDGNKSHEERDLREELSRSRRSSHHYIEKDLRDDYMHHQEPTSRSPHRNHDDSDCDDERHQSMDDHEDEHRREDATSRERHNSRDEYDRVSRVSQASKSRDDGFGNKYYKSRPKDQEYRSSDLVMGSRKDVEYRKRNSNNSGYKEQGSGHEPEQDLRKKHTISRYQDIDYKNVPHSTHNNDTTHSPLQARDSDLRRQSFSHSPDGRKYPNNVHLDLKGEIIMPLPASAPGLLDHNYCKEINFPLNNIVPLLLILMAGEIFTHCLL